MMQPLKSEHHLVRVSWQHLQFPHHGHVLDLVKCPSTKETSVSQVYPLVKEEEKQNPLEIKHSKESAEDAAEQAILVEDP